MTRDQTAREIARIGARRRKAIAAQRSAEAELRPLLAVAVAERLPLRSLSADTGLSVSTIRVWVAEETVRGSEAPAGTPQTPQATGRPIGREGARRGSA